MGRPHFNNRKTSLENRKYRNPVHVAQNQESGQKNFKKPPFLLANTKY
jgi:hypothetical protein